MYTEIAYEHFMSPQNAYFMPDAHGEGHVGDPACGDSLSIFYKGRK